MRRRQDRTTGALWEARWRDAGGRQRKRAFTRKSDAVRYLTDVEAALNRGAYVDPSAGRVTIGDWGASWLERSAAAWKPSTVESNLSLWRSQVAPRWGTTPLSAVRHADVSAWVADLVRAGLSASRARQSYHLLTAMLDAAVADGRIARNAAEKVPLPRLVAAPRRYLSHTELRRLADEAGDDGRLLVLLLGYTGLRFGEAVALRASSVDADRGRLRIDASTTAVAGKLVTTTPKTHRSREVPVPAFLLPLLAEAVGPIRPECFVFRAPRGGQLRETNWRPRVFDGAARRAGFEGLVPHELRHTAASLAISAGASVKAVQRMLGHASAAMTLDLYGHLWDDELDDVAARLDAAARAALPRAAEGRVHSSV